MGRKQLVILGERYGRLTVIRRTVKKVGSPLVCICDCGKIVFTSSNKLRIGRIKSCGCFSRERSRRHGLYGTPEYNAWKSMKQRCLNKNNKSYKWYGARSIKIHPPWIKDFYAFFVEAGKRPSEKFSIDRIDNDGHYIPGNIRWATKKQQIENRRPRNQWVK